MQPTLATRLKISQALKAKGIRPSFLGRRHSEATKQRISEVLKRKGIRPPASKKSEVVEVTCLGCKVVFLAKKYKNYLKKYCSHPCSLKDNARTNPHFQKGRKVDPEITLKFSGPNHYLWKGGVTPKLKKLYFSVEYKAWRKAVFERDGFTCVWCGAKGNMQADHIKPFAHFPKLRFDVNNGRTLCTPCHKKTDTFGWKTWNKRRAVFKRGLGPPPV